MSDGGLRDWPSLKKTPTVSYSWNASSTARRKVAGSIAREHLAHVPEVLPVAPLHLCQRLSVEIEMKERYPADLGDECPAVFPPGWDGDEVRRRGELHVDLELLLQRRYRTEERIVLGTHHKVHVDRRPPPAQEHRRRAAYQMDAHVRPGRAPECLHQPLDTLAIG